MVIWYIQTFFFFFLSNSSVYPCHLFVISSVSIRSLLFLSFIVPSLHKCFLGISNFPEGISGIFPFYCFLLFLCIVHLRLSCLSFLFSGVLRSVGFMFPFLLCLLLLFFSQLFLKDSSDNHFAFLHFFFPLGWLWSAPPIQRYESLSIVFQAYCLPDLVFDFIIRDLI